MFPAIEPSEVGATGLAWLLISYGYVLYYASNLISEGSELLLLVPSMASFVGGTVLPLLGAVPDGAILLFSGLGPISTAQATLSVGVGALAGSTIMLLTVPWGLSVIGGRVDLVGPYNRPNYMGKPKLQTKGFINTLRRTGVALTSQVNDGGVVMMVTTIPYFLIQIPASIYEAIAPGKADDAYISSKERVWALTGFCICLIGFVSYLWFQVKTSQKGAEKLKRIAVTKKYVHDGVVSLSGVMGSTIKGVAHDAQNLRNSEHQALLDGSNIPPAIRENLEGVLRDVFYKYDKDDNGTLEPSEFKEVLQDLNEPVAEDNLREIFDRHDADSDGAIDFDEFISSIWCIMWERMLTTGDELAIENLASDVDVSSEREGEDEPEDPVPEGLLGMSPEQQQKVIKRHAFVQLAVGTTLVVLFSDPMVDVLADLANRIGISPFYVSFVLAPLASNASEVIASQYYAAKKTRKTMTVSLTALEGAASMNNTFCLSILLGLIFFRRLVWEYTAETIAILVVEFIVGINAVRKPIMKTWEACCVISLFPLSIALVAGLEALGFD